MQGWLHRSSRLLVMLGAAGPHRARRQPRRRSRQTLTLIDPANPTQRRRLAELPGTGWFVGGVSWDDKQVALTRYVSATESQLWLLDAGQRQDRRSCCRRRAARTKATLPRRRLQARRQRHLAVSATATASSAQLHALPARPASGSRR